MDAVCGTYFVRNLAIKHSKLISLTLHHYLSSSSTSGFIIIYILLRLVTTCWTVSSKTKAHVKFVQLLSSAWFHHDHFRWKQLNKLDLKQQTNSSAVPSDSISSRLICLLLLPPHLLILYYAINCVHLCDKVQSVDTSKQRFYFTVD